MIYGNKVALQIIKKIEENIKNEKINSGFFIISGPKNIGKKTIIFDLIKNLGILEQDKLILEDPGKEDGKLYQIKVDEELTKIETNNKIFYSMGARQIAEFISTTTAGKLKVVFIENLERLNISSANALLKILEEMPKNIFIFTTTSNKSKLLPTILSRANIINMHELSQKDFHKFLEDNMIILEKKKEHILFSISGGRIGLAKRLLEESNNLLDKIEEFLELEEKKTSVWGRYSLIKDLIQENKINLFLDGLIFYYSHTNNFDKVQKLTDIKQKNQANVNLENLLFSHLIN